MLLYISNCDSKSVALEWAEDFLLLKSWDIIKVVVDKFPVQIFMF